MVSTSEQMQVPNGTGPYSYKTVSVPTISRAIRNDLDLRYKRLTKPAAERFTFDNLRYTEVFMYYFHQQVAPRVKFVDESVFRPLRN